ncbi:MAG TPA: Fur family transcriptional regulator [Xanthobacteraceae bacterium]|nr:Fur family transcriptional regulator [Xanthobacteraceae bacterium]
MNAGFPAPNHDHKRCIADALARADEACNAQGMRLTPLRRRVLQTLAESHSPLGAYEITERLKKTREPVPTMSVYRALDFLLEAGLVHRIESKNAFLACIHGHESDDIVLFLLCERCERVAEVTSGALGRDLTQAARGVGFSARMRVLEVTGLCNACKKTEARA